MLIIQIIYLQAGIDKVEKNKIIPYFVQNENTLTVE